MNIICHVLTIPSIPHYPFSPSKRCHGYKLLFIPKTNGELQIVASHDRITSSDILSKINHDVIAEFITPSNCPCGCYRDRKLDIFSHVDFFSLSILNLRDHFMVISKVVDCLNRIFT
jgi:hypothetical protein